MCSILIDNMERGWNGEEIEIDKVRSKTYFKEDIG